jgi:hypothetical protein
MKPDAQPNAGSRGLVDDGSRLTDVERQRLVDEDVLAPLEGGQRLLSMEAVRCGDVDDINGWVLQHLDVVVVTRGSTVLLRESFRAVEATTAYRGEGALFVGVDRRSDGDISYLADSDDAPADAHACPVRIEVFIFYRSSPWRLSR